jgi:hypothetical protein
VNTLAKPAIETSPEEAAPAAGRAVVTPAKEGVGS